MSIEGTLAFWHRGDGLRAGSRYLVPGMDALVDVLAIEERGEYLDVKVRDTVTRRPAVKTIKREARV